MGTASAQSPTGKALSLSLAPARHIERLSDQDAGFIYAESAAAPLNIGFIAIFEGRLDFARLRDHVANRLDLRPRFRQRLRPVPFNLAHPVIEDDPNFRLENHLIRHRLRARTGRAAAMDQIVRCFATPLDRSRPLWEIHVFEPFDDGRTALLAKVHHALADGVAALELFRVLFDLSPAAAPSEAAPWRPERSQSRWVRLFDALREQATKPITIADRLGRDPDAARQNLRMASEAARLLGKLARPIIATPWNSGLVGPRRALNWSSFRFSDMTAIRGALGGSLNDVALTILSEGAARYLAHHGYSTKGHYLRIGCPVSMRGRHERSMLGNRVSMMFPTLPAWPIEPSRRLWLTALETRRFKNMQAAEALDRLLVLGGAMVPPFIARMAVRGGVAMLEALAPMLKALPHEPPPKGVLLPALGINFIATNVPGIRVPLYMMGQRCLHQIPLVPIGATLGYGVAILRYGRDLYFGMVTDPDLLPDGGLMKHFVDEAFAELRKSARRGSHESVDH